MARSLTDATEGLRKTVALSLPEKTIERLDGQANKESDAGLYRVNRSQLANRLLREGLDRIDGGE